MRNRLVAAVVGLGVVLAGTAMSLSAHHAFSAEFDAKKPDGKTLFMGSSGTGAPYELVPDHVKQQTGQAGPGTKK